MAQWRNGNAAVCKTAIRGFDSHLRLRMKVYHSRKYLLNEFLFDKWSSDMAYVLGFWFADGYMRKEKSYRINFVSNDKEILKKISRVLKSTNIIRKRKNDNSWRLTIHSKYAYGRLLKLGGFRRKSKIMTFPEVPKKYLRDFIRGYFDGDGSIFFVKYISTKNFKPRVELRSNFTSGSKVFLRKLMNILSKEAGLIKKKICSYNDGCTFKLGYGMGDTVRLMKFIYYHRRLIGLDRKLQVYYTAKRQIKSKLLY